MRQPIDILILSPAGTAEIFAGFQNMSAYKVEIMSDGFDRQSGIHIEAHKLCLHCRRGEIQCRLLIMAMTETLRSQHSHPLQPVLPGVRELVLIGEGRLLLEQSLALAGHAKKITMVRRRADDACRRVVFHYFSRLRRGCSAFHCG